jgi:hypothetical protein
MDDHVRAVDQLGQDRRVAHRFDRVVEAGVLFEVLDVLDASGGEVIDDADFVAALQICLGQMRADEAGASCDQKPQRKTS